MRALERRRLRVRLRRQVHLRRSDRMLPRNVLNN